MKKKKKTISLVLRSIQTTTGFKCTLPILDADTSSNRNTDRATCILPIDNFSAVTVTYEADLAEIVLRTL